MELRLITLLSLLLLSSGANAGPYTGLKNIACPEGWESTTAVIPVISDDLNPWSDNQDDKSATQTHLGNTQPIITIDKVPSMVDSLDLVDDELTVASDCLVYRNFEVDTYNYVAPVSNSTNEYGWMPAAIF